ncbi:MAG: hypothetical protein ACI9LY_002343 [Arenicella sp.]|jgi:hypothetical protein
MKTLCLAAVLMLISGCHPMPSIKHETIGNSRSKHDFWRAYTRLTGDQIVRAFSDVVDQATVVDGAGGMATNHWYKDGRFNSNWQVADKTGQLAGRWYVEKEKRCVVIDTVVIDLQTGQPSCGPIYSKEGKYYSVNPSGSMHGIHVLTGFD